VVELRELLGKEFARRPRLEWLAELEHDGVLAGIVRSYADVLDDPQLRANQALEQHVLTDGRTAVFPRAPFRFAGRPLEGTRSAPELGADTAGLLAEIGVDTARLDHLYEAGVITGERPK
jgi:crotonobetainyl-CoA:carnitine CoA-transferase CaiB-like acyl-CoA transferase